MICNAAFMPGLGNNCLSVASWIRFFVPLPERTTKTGAHVEGFAVLRKLLYTRWIILLFAFKVYIRFSRRDFVV
jgi:hypothetical protein